MVATPLSVAKEGDEPAAIEAEGTADEAESADLKRMMRRFRIGVVLTLPVLFLAMVHVAPVLGNQTWVDGDSHG